MVSRPELGSNSPFELDRKSGCDTNGTGARAKWY